MISFTNAFFSYVMLLLVVVILGGIAIFIGITLRKNKNRKEEAEKNSLEEAEKAGVE